jgi:hypothetical protein
LLRTPARKKFKTPLLPLLRQGFAAPSHTSLSIRAKKEYKATDIQPQHGSGLEKKNIARHESRQKEASKPKNKNRAGNECHEKNPCGSSRVGERRRRCRKSERKKDEEDEKQWKK